VLTNAFVLFVFVTNYQSSTRVGYKDWQLDSTSRFVTIHPNQPTNQQPTNEYQIKNQSN